MIIAKSKNLKAFICALVCTLIVLSPSFSAPQRVEASAGALAIVATVGVIAIGLTYLYGTGLTSRIVEKCKQSDFAKYVASIGNKAIQYGTGVGLYSVAQRTVNDLIKKGVSSTTISATTDPGQAMSLLTTNNVAVKPTSSEITAIVNSIPANTVVDNPSYVPKSSIFKPYEIPDISSFSNYSLVEPYVSNIAELYLRLSDFTVVSYGRIPVGVSLYNPSSSAGFSVISSAGPLEWRFKDYKIMSDSDGYKLIYPSSIINGICFKGSLYYPCHIDNTTGICDVYIDDSVPSLGNTDFSNFSVVWVQPIIVNPSDSGHSVVFSCFGSWRYDRSILSSDDAHVFYAASPPTNRFTSGHSLNSLYSSIFTNGCYLVDLNSYDLASTVHVKASDISTYYGSGTRDIYEDTPSLNINKVAVDVAQPDIHVKLSDTDTGDNVYLPIVTDVAIDGFTVSTDTVVDTVQDTIPDEVIDNIDASLDDYVAENPTDTNVVVDTTGIVTSIDYVTQAIEDSNYHKGFTVPNFNIDVPQYDSNFLSRWGKWIEFTRGVFNGLSGTELGGIVITSALIMVAVAVFRKVL